jgi:hypothetical protein
VDAVKSGSVDLVVANISPGAIVQLSPVRELRQKGSWDLLVI